jgi:glycosyltransferase involved in cell wall biosynthesis
MIELSIVIPCYNESTAIPILLEQCRVASLNRIDIEFIIVDNGSTDETNKILLRTLSDIDFKGFKSLRIEKNIGYGNGIVQGLLAASGNILSYTHADLQCNPSDVITAFDQYKNQLRDNQCLIKGRRVNRGIVDSFFTWGMSVFSSWILGVHLSDVNAQPKIFHRLFFQQLINPPSDFSLDLFILYSARKKNIPIISFPVIFSKRHSGQAKGGGTWKGKYKLIKRTLAYILNLRKEVKK